MTRRTFSTDIKNILHNNSTNAYEVELFSGDKITFDNAENNDNLKNLVVYLNRNYYKCCKRTQSNALTVAYYLTFNRIFNRFNGNNNIAPENEIFEYFTYFYEKVKETSDEDLNAKQVYAIDGCVINTDGSVEYIGFSDNLEDVTSDGYYKGKKVRKFNRLQAEMFSNRYSNFAHKPLRLV